MSDDIVERLRSVGPETWVDHVAMAKAAADEIDRLREALRRIDAAIRHGLGHYKGAVSEKIVREVALITRAALKESGDE